MRLAPNCRVLVLLIISANTLLGQIEDPLPDIPLGNVVVMPLLLSGNLPVEQVQTNPVGFIQEVGPTDLAEIPNGSGNQIIVNYGGAFLRLGPDGTVAETPFMDLANSESPSYNDDFEIGQAHGATAIAFHPGFADMDSPGYRKFYTLEPETAMSGLADFGGSNFPSIRSAAHHDEVLYEYTMASVNDTICGNDCSKRELMRVLQPGWHHNLGDLVFDTEEMLYVSSGDGSTASTSPPYISDNATLLTNVFGKVLRIDPFGSNSANGKYGIPANPFADGAGGNVDEIYAYGLRNPYRLGYDPVTGDLFASETGENTIESVNRIVAGGNHGWDEKEGSFLYDKTTKAIAIDVDADANGIRDFAESHGLIDPVFEYDRGNGRSVIGGVLYRGSLFPELQGHYVFADFNGDLFYGNPATGEEFVFRLDPTSDPLPSFIHSVNAGVDGELYVLGIRQVGAQDFDGWLVQLTPPTPACDFNGDRLCDAIDLDLLTAHGDLTDGVTVPPGESSPFDLNNDEQVDLQDRDSFLSLAAATNGLSAAYIVGDADLSSTVDFADFLILSNHFGQETDAVWSLGDFDGNGAIAFADFLILSSHFGETADLVLGVPEPSTSRMALWVLGLALLARPSGRASSVLALASHCRTPSGFRCLLWTRFPGWR